MNYIYILRSFGKNRTILKFGYSSDIFARLYQYQAHNPDIEIVYIAQLENAHEIELAFHKDNKSLVGNEWYDESLLQTMLNYLNKFTHKDCTDNKKPVKECNFFKDVVIECKRGDSDYLLWAFEKYDFLHNAIKYLGYDKLENYDYNITRIKRALMTVSDKDKEMKIKELLQEYNLSKGIFVSNEKLKQIFNEIYKDLNIDKTPKAKDIENYYKVKTTLKIIKEIRTNGVIIL